MKFILSVLLLASLNIYAEEDCTKSLAFLNLKTIRYTTSKISGDYAITYSFPDLTKLKETSCGYSNYTKKYEINFYSEELKKNPIRVEIKRNNEVTQTDDVTFLKLEKPDSSEPYMLTLGALSFLQEDGPGIFRILCDVHFKSGDSCKDGGADGYFHNIEVELR